MEDYLKAVGLVLIAVILCLALSSHAKNYIVLICLAVCCILGSYAVRYLDPVIELFYELRDLGGWNEAYLSVLVKAVGLGFMTEIVVMICNDSGNSALGKTLQFLGNAVIIWISIPLFTAVLDLIKEILEGI